MSSAPAASAVDPAEIDRLGKAALGQIVAKQIEAGIDIGNNGEQQREAFFLYVRHRMSGFGGSWKRWPRGDVERYPLLKAQMAQMLAAREAVGNYQPPKAIGEVRYVDDSELKAECADFRAALDARPDGFVEPFMTAPSPGIIAAAMKNEYYDSDDGLSRRGRRRPQDRIRGDRQGTASCCSSIAPTSRSNGT